MTLDRRDYNTAIPQLEKRLEAVESVGDKSLADLDVLSSLLEKESAERERLYLKNVTQIQAVQATANGKNKIFRQSSQPTSGMADGDIWFDTSNDNKISRYNGSSWVAFTLGDDALDSLSANKLTAGTIDASVITVSNLDAGNITTGTLDASHIDASTLTIGGSHLATQSDIPTDVSELNNDSGYQTSSDVSTAINNIEIGGKNLVWDTRWENISTRWSNWGSPTTREIVELNSKRWLHIVTTTSAYQGYQQAQTNRNGYGEVAEGQKVICGFTAYSAVAGQKACIGIHWRNSSGTNVSQNWQQFTLTTTATRYTTPVWTVPTGAVGFNIMVGDNTSSAQEFWISEVKAEFGNKATDWSPAPEDLVKVFTASCSTAAGTVAKVATTNESGFSLTTGVMVNVKFTNTNSGDAGSLTLDINGTGAKNIKYIYNGSINNIPNKGYLKAGQMYTFVYDGTYWVVQMIYNTDTVNRLRRQNIILAVSAITAGHLICGTSAGYKMVDAGVSFDLSYPLLHASSDIAANATGDNNFLALNTVKASTYGTIEQGTIYKTLYLKGTLSGSTFTVATSPFLTCKVPNSKDGFVYIPIGVMYTTSYIYFESSDKLYAYKGGKFQEVGYGYANAHITEIGDDGVRVHAEDNASTNYTQVDSDGMDVVKGGESVAFYGDYARIGSNSSNRIEIQTSGIDFVASNGENLFRVIDNGTEIQDHIENPAGLISWTTTGTKQLTISTSMPVTAIKEVYIYFDVNGEVMYNDEETLPYSDGHYKINHSFSGQNITFTIEKLESGTDKILYVDVFYETTKRNGSLLCGVYPNYDSVYSDIKAQTPAFVVGNGTSRQNTKDVFKIDYLGNIYINETAFIDFVTEQGTENGWTYRKWYSGKRECWATASYTGNLSTSNGGWYCDSSSGRTIPDYPTSLFSSQPYQYVSAVCDGYSTNVDACIMGANRSLTNFGNVLLHRGSSYTTSRTYIIYMHAIQL